MPSSDFKIYELLSGKIGRRTLGADGEVVNENYRSPLLFVPSPGELKVNKLRLRDTGSVADPASPMVRDAILNTNKLDYPEFGKDAPAIPGKPPVDVSDIRTILGEAAEKVILATADTDLLDTYFLQESDNKPRIRAFVLKAIEKQRAQLQAATAQV